MYSFLGLHHHNGAGHLVIYINSIDVTGSSRSCYLYYLGWTRVYVFTEKEAYYSTKVNKREGASEVLYVFATVIHFKYDH